MAKQLQKQIQAVWLWAKAKRVPNYPFMKQEAGSSYRRRSTTYDAVHKADCTCTVLQREVTLPLLFNVYVYNKRLDPITNEVRIEAFF